MGTLIGMILRSHPRVVVQYRRVEPVPNAPAPDPQCGKRIAGSGVTSGQQPCHSSPGSGPQRADGRLPDPLCDVNPHGFVSIQPIR